jgi:hypothetical protein
MANSLTRKERIDQLRGWIDDAKRIVVLTGAGISTESGIPDFRGPKGVWTRNPAAEKASNIQHYLRDPEVRRVAWQTRVNGRLFAAEPIAKGTVVWRRHPAIDVLLSGVDVGSLAPAAREQIEKYTYLDRVLGRLVLCGDDARFFKHSGAPNCLDFPDETGGTTVAARDIAAGEELTSDYAAFDANHGALERG